MKLTRKRAIEKAVENGHWKTNSFTACAQLGVDYGIVLGLQMAARIIDARNDPAELKIESALRLKKLEKQ